MALLGLFTGLWWLSAIILILGLALVIFEMFHPGFGAPGITGGVLLILGILLTARSVFQALIMIVILLAILGIVLTIVLRSATKGYISRNLVLYDSLNKAKNSNITNDLEFFLDKEGITLTVLRPSGMADFDDVKLDVVSEGDFIPKNARVKIIKIEGRRIVVKEIKE